ncbi:MAG: ATP synthase F1 subunit gamma [Firmicutes bacterium]|jgi:F-type H+-transporting ATPase subunit gamma|nr:ATP synthase F1 subunit gamma [Bacillota bacterium]
MASMREIKRRRTSIQSTQQITKAMKLVSTVKLQRARQRAENSKAYFTYMYKTITSMLAKAGNVDHPYVKGSDSKNVAIVTVTSNRGLAGGYNANIVRMVMGSGFDKENVRLYTVGRKGAEGLERKGYRIVADYSDVIEEPTFADAKEIGERLLADFANGEIGEIYVAYTEFKNTVSQVPKLMKLLPVDAEGMQADAEELSELDKLTPMNFEPEEEEAIALLIPKYMTSILYGAFVEAVASENGARMQAMDSATNNAEEIISDLELKYNRARQGAITQELTEIIAGAEAIG